MVGGAEILAIAGAKKAAEEVAKDTYLATKSIARKSLDKLLVEFGVGFGKYLSRNYQKCRYVKTLLHRVDPIPIESAYVDPTFKIKGKTVAGAHFLDNLENLKRVVVTGLGGSGKSMFMKHTFLELCNDSFGRIPIFVELRELNETLDKNLFSCIHSQLVSLIPSFNSEQLEYAFRAGKFVVLFDGLDEIDFSHRDFCCKQLLDLTYKYPNCLFLVTSRPDDRFDSWSEFYGAEICALDENQIRTLVRRIDYNEETKESFLTQIEKTLLKSHRGFLSNPLLCTMMLMTYAEFEEIPSKMHIFYSRAFDALFSRHDKMKTSFKRKFYTDLSEDEFKRLFATFCLLTYLDRKIILDEVDAKKYIKLSIDYEGMTVSADDFLKDLSISVSVLLKDGDVYSFLHRSFQEYFSAVFLSERQSANIKMLFERVSFGFEQDSVIDLLMEIRRDAFESKFFAAKVKSFKRVLSKINHNERPEAVFSLLFNRMTVERGTGRIQSLRITKWYSVLRILERYYLSNKLTPGVIDLLNCNYKTLKKMKGGRRIA